MVRMLCRGLASVGALSVLLVIASPAAAERSRTGPSESAAKPYVDVRSGAVRDASRPGARPLRTLSGADRAARGRLVAGLGRQAVDDADPITATPRSLGRLDGTLTGPHSGDPADLALRYVSGHAAALGLTAADLGTLRLATRTTVGGVTSLRWRQEAGGIPLADNDLRATVDGDGRVVAIAGAPRAGLTAPATPAALSAADARAAAARDAGVSHAATITNGPTGPRRETTFDTGDRAALVLFGDAAGVRLAWDVTYRATPDAWYDTVVDASSGAILRRANLVKGITNASVFQHYPGAAQGGVQTTVDLDQYLNPAATTLDGPFAHAWSDLDDASANPPAETPQPAEEVVPGVYPFQDFTGSNLLGACDAAHQCSWDAGLPSSWDNNREQNAVQVFWFVNQFHDHLLRPQIGFDAASGNFEAAGGDAVIAQTDDGATTDNGVFPDGLHLDNANMTTLPDGQAPVMQMYLFFNNTLAPPNASPFRDVNGGDDASVVYHEYTHGLSNRLVVDGTGAGALGTAQAAAMGEGWSDWYAKDFVVGSGLETDTAAPGEIDMGAYVDASSTAHGIRTQPTDCPVVNGGAACPGTTTAGSGGYTYGDFGRISGTDEHANGEIWGETLWDLRAALGSDVTEAIVTGGMRVSPAEPSFLEERNAILQADTALFGGVHVNAIWAVFARRGMGFNATTAGSTDTAPVQDFSLPPAPQPGAAAPVAVPAGGATPQSVPARAAVLSAVAPARPTARIERSAVRGRATFTVGCSVACRATATMTITRARARTVGLGRTTRLARVTRRVTGRARRTFGIGVSGSALRRMRAKGVISIGVTIAVQVRDDGGRTRTARRALTVRVQ